MVARPAKPTAKSKQVRTPVRNRRTSSNLNNDGGFAYRGTRRIISLQYKAVVRIRIRIESKSIGDAPKSPNKRFTEFCPPVFGVA